MIEINKGINKPTSNEAFETNTRITNSDNCIVDKCVFKYSDGSGIEIVIIILCKIAIFLT